MARVYYGYDYQLVPGDGDSGNHLFRISKTGDGYSKLYTASPIDYEAYHLMINPFVTIRLRVTDERGNYFEKKITLNILDVQEIPDKLKVDVVLIGAGGGAGGADDGNGGPGGSGSQFAFATTLQVGETYGLHVGSAGLGGLNNAFISYTSTGGPGGETPAFSGGFFGGKGGHCGPHGSSGGGGGGGAATVLSYYKRGGMGRGWRSMAAAAGGGGGTGRRELPAYPGRGGDLEFKNTHLALYGDHKTVGGIGFNYSGDGPGGGGGGGGASGGQGASSAEGSYGGKSGITRTTFKPTSQTIVSGQTGKVVSGGWHLHGLAQRTAIGSAPGKWWNKMNLVPAGAGSGGFSGYRAGDRGNSNGQAGAAIIRYKDTYPRIKLGGSYSLSGGYHIHVFNGSATHSLEMELYE